MGGRRVGGGRENGRTRGGITQSPGDRVGFEGHATQAPLTWFNVLLSLS